MNTENKKGWTFLFPVHDSVYLKADYDCRNEVIELMERHAKASGVKIKVT